MLVYPLHAVRVLGIDPGSRHMGFAVLDSVGNRHTAQHYGVVDIKTESLDKRLNTIFTAVLNIVDEYQPAVVAVERVFVHKNVESALKLGHARGAAISAAAFRACPVAEYSPTEIKKAVVGQGRAQKPQVQFMVARLTGITTPMREDAADALACALCHSFQRGAKTLYTSAP